MSPEYRPHIVNVNVKITERDGWFVAICKELPGFYLVHQDREAILEDVPEAIRVLVKAQHDLDCRVLPMKKSFDLTQERQRPARKSLFPWAAVLDNSLAVPAHA